MEDWPSYANITVPNSCNMDQVTQQATLLSARIGIEVAPISLYKYEDWLDSFKVGALPRLHSLVPCSMRMCTPGKIACLRIHNGGRLALDVQPSQSQRIEQGRVGIAEGRCGGPRHKVQRGATRLG